TEVAARASCELVPCRDQELRVDFHDRVEYVPLCSDTSVPDLRCDDERRIPQPRSATREDHWLPHLLSILEDTTAKLPVWLILFGDDCVLMPKAAYEAGDDRGDRASVPDEVPDTSCGSEVVRMGILHLNTKRQIRPVLCLEHLTRCLRLAFGLRPKAP